MGRASGSPLLLVGLISAPFAFACELRCLPASYSGGPLPSSPAGPSVWSQARMTQHREDDLTIAVRLPFHAMGVLAYLGVRAMPGVEEVVGMTYRRVVSRRGRAGILSVDLSSAQRGRIDVCCDLPRSPVWATEKVRSMIDAETDVVP